MLSFRTWMVEIVKFLQSYLTHIFRVLESMDSIYTTQDGVDRKYMQIVIWVHIIFSLKFLQTRAKINRSQWRRCLCVEIESQQKMTFSCYLCPTGSRSNLI